MYLIYQFNVKVATTLTSAKQAVFPEKKDELNLKKSLYEISSVLYPSQIYIYIYVLIFGGRAVGLTPLPHLVPSSERVEVYLYSP